MLYASLCLPPCSPAKRSSGHTSVKQRCLEILFGEKVGMLLGGIDSSQNAGAGLAMVSGRVVGERASSGGGSSGNAREKSFFGALPCVAIKKEK